MRRRNLTPEGRFSARTLLALAATALPRVLAVRAAAGSDPAEILLYDEIGFWGITAKDFAAALAAAGDGPIRVRINSPGGDVFDGMAIYNQMLVHPARVDTVVDGLAASAASYIALAGQTVSMHDSSMMMMHNAWGFAVGNRHAMTEMAGVLAKIDGQLAGIYAHRTGKPADEMAAMMDAETWLTAQEAKDAGFADAVLPPPERGAKALARARVLRAAAEEWTVGAARDLPIQNSDSWDGPGAAERMLADAGFNSGNPDPDKAKRGFLVYDAAQPKLKGSYKLPFADIVQGELKAVDGGIDAAASRLPQTDIPDDVRDRARAVLDAYEARTKPDADDEKSSHDQRRRRARLALAECD